MSQFFWKGNNKVGLFGCNSVASGFRYNNKNILGGEKQLITNYYDEYVNLNGWKIQYLVQKFDFNKADMFYGEDPIGNYEAAQDMIALINLDEGNVNLARFGFNPEETLTIVFTINQFTTIFNSKEYFRRGRETRPKAGDLISLEEYGRTRYGDRGPKYFEVTQVLDTNIKENINQLGFQYVWQLKAKRFEYSYEKDVTPEKGSNQISEDKLSVTDLQNQAILSKFETLSTNTLSTVLSSTGKSYEYNVDTDRSNNSTLYKGIDSVYGGF